jgi:ABC-type multidrug transport system fused ATPase/permease subunit
MYFILENNLTLGNLVAFNSYSAMFSSALFKISTLNIKIHKSIISLKRVFEFLEKHETKKVFENNENIEDKTFLFKENLLIHNLYFKYNHSCNIIENLNTKIEKKKINVIAGLSGCGKTTLVSIIMGLYDNYEGTIVLGNTDYKNISIENKFNNIVFVTQESFFFNGTIKENLLIESPEVTEDEIISVCQKVNIHDYINSLPQKYDSILGYSGTEFSAGQKQKLSLARALLRKREIYIFDEITSSVDSFSEKIILHTIKELSKTKTIILISHRKTTLSIADNYIYFKNINEKKFKKEVIVRE